MKNLTSACIMLTINTQRVKLGNISAIGTYQVVIGQNLDKENTEIHVERELIDYEEITLDGIKVDNSFGAIRTFFESYASKGILLEEQIDKELDKWFDENMDREILKASFINAARTLPNYPIVFPEKSQPKYPEYNQMDLELKKHPLEGTSPDRDYEQK